MLATGSLVASATAVRVALGSAELVVQRTPPLLSRAVSASFGGSQSATAEAVFRDNLLALARDSADLGYREMRRAVDQLDALTRPRQATGARPHRPYRVKS
jgi:hypothetical protein